MKSACLNIVRKHDPDRFLLSLMAAMRCRPALWALFAFNYEIAKTREVVSETTIGLIRLQWWRDAIAEIYEGKPVRRHEVVDELATAIKEYDLPREDFDNLIYAREFDLEGVAPANIEGLNNYCDFTTTPLYRLALKITGESCYDSGESARLRSESIRYARIGILRSVPFMRSQRRVMLPQDVLIKNNLSEQKFCDFNQFENLPEVIKEVLESDNGFRNDQSKPKSRFLRAITAMSDLYTAQIESVRYDVFDPKLQVAPPFMALRVWIMSRF
ncbi:MAG TPA: squalene/phytoene synthase family protein [Alphaproteobacteria bacterium]|nr:squalene/phytoene synthase family protein [Alphaproteobacteria bacterium]